MVDGGFYTLFFSLVNLIFGCKSYSFSLSPKWTSDFLDEGVRA